MQPERVLITGTTSGVGGALLAHYVERGALVVAVNRRRVPQLESRHPSVRFECVDVRSEESVARLIERLSECAELPEVFLLNAGINRVDNDTSFRLDNYRDVIDTNLYGVLNFVRPLTRLSSMGVARHLVAISSMASYVGNPYALGYHTSKRALTACFDTWSRMYAGTDLVFQQVMLGPVPTAITTSDAAFSPWVARTRNLFSASLDHTAPAIARFARTRTRKLHYPRRAVPLYFGMWLGQSLIPGFLRGRRTLDGRARRTPNGEGASPP